MSSQVQRLLEAEQEAAKIVQDARQSDRTQKLKDARTEAAKEIEAYKKQKEEEFKSLEGQRAGNTSNAQDAVDKDTEAKIAAINDAYAKQKDGVVQKLLDRVVLVKPELHRNLTKLEA
ncbi:V-type proton ATPase subunit G, partial [Rhizoctonia solani]|uniref:V-type proton ATPase subunit G n=1 Tax=Rhizoctonia solani TaxID=456999 RepID=A0A8H7IFE6_9AGAM